MTQVPEAIVRFVFDAVLKGAAEPAHGIRGALAAVLAERDCEECGGYAKVVHEGTPWPIRKALGAPPDHTYGPCPNANSTCFSGKEYVARVATTSTSQGEVRECQTTMEET